MLSGRCERNFTLRLVLCLWGAPGDARLGIIRAKGDHTVERAVNSRFE
jgi:hypothetical protein